MLLEKLTRMKRKLRNLVIKPIMVLMLLLGPYMELWAEVPGKGISVAEFLSQAGIISIIVALIGILLIEFVFKKKLSRNFYKWTLFIGLFILPVFAMISTFSTVMKDTKTVESCASCHVMDPFVSDMFDENSPNLAARHYKNKWIADNQCYQCHTSYGIHGTLEGKRDGFRHWLYYVTETWPEPIVFKGSYPNQNCNSCHYDTPNFNEVMSHISIKDRLLNDEVSCSSCHGPVHPTPLERPQVSQDVTFSSTDDAMAIKEYISTFSHSGRETKGQSSMIVKQSTHD